jgi:hypothetical protein
MQSKQHVRIAAVCRLQSLLKPFVSLVRLHWASSVTVTHGTFLSEAGRMTVSRVDREAVGEEVGRECSASASSDEGSLARCSWQHLGQDLLLEEYMYECKGGRRTHTGAVLMHYLHCFLTSLTSEDCHVISGRQEEA